MLTLPNKLFAVTRPSGEAQKQMPWIAERAPTLLSTQEKSSSVLACDS